MYGVRSQKLFFLVFSLIVLVRMYICTSTFCLGKPIHLVLQRLEKLPAMSRHTSLLGRIGCIRRGIVRGSRVQDVELNGRVAFHKGAL